MNVTHRVEVSTKLLKDRPVTYKVVFEAYREVYSGPLTVEKLSVEFIERVCRGEQARLVLKDICSQEFSSVSISKTVSFEGVNTTTNNQKSYYHNLPYIIAPITSLLDKTLKHTSPNEQLLLIHRTITAIITLINMLSELHGMQDFERTCTVKRIRVAIEATQCKVLVAETTSAMASSFVIGGDIKKRMFVQFFMEYLLRVIMAETLTAQYALTVHIPEDISDVSDHRLIITNWMKRILAIKTIDTKSGHSRYTRTVLFMAMASIAKWYRGEYCQMV